MKMSIIIGSTCSFSRARSPASPPSAIVPGDDSGADRSRWPCTPSGPRRQRECDAGLPSPFELRVSAIQIAPWDTPFSSGWGRDIDGRKRQRCCREIRDRCDSRGAAKPRRQSRMVGNARLRSEAAGVGRRPMAARMRCFRLATAPLPLFPAARHKTNAPNQRADQRAFLNFRRKCRSLSAPQRVYGRQHNRYNMFWSPCNWMTHRTRRPIVLLNAPD